MDDVKKLVEAVRAAEAAWVQAIKDFAQSLGWSPVPGQWTYFLNGGSSWIEVVFDLRSESDPYCAFALFTETTSANYQWKSLGLFNHKERKYLSDKEAADFLKLWMKTGEEIVAAKENANDVLRAALKLDK